MTILVLLTDGFGGRGGIAKFNRDLLTAIAAHPNCRNVVALPRLAPDPIENVPAKIDYVTAGLGGRLKYVAAVLRRCAREKNLSCVICAHINLLPLARLCARRAGVPLALVIHGTDAWQPTGRLSVDRAVRHVDALISVSETTLHRFQEWSSWNGRWRFVLPNCIHLDRYQPGPKSATLVKRYELEGKKIIMTLGRLSAEERYKGVDEIIDILPGLAQEIPDIAYVVAGDGSDRARLRERADAAGLNGRVVFTGYVPEAEKADHYRLADAYVMPGRGEGFGIVYLEAMACGVPVVASTADASREVVRDGKLGLLVDPDKPGQIRGAIVAALRRGTGQVPDGLDYFSYQNFERRAHAILDQLVPPVATK